MNTRTVDLQRALTPSPDIWPATPFSNDRNLWLGLIGRKVLSEGSEVASTAGTMFVTDSGMRSPCAHECPVAVCRASDTQRVRRLPECQVQRVKSPVVV
jgi:hypothetical protein